MADTTPPDIARSDADIEQLARELDVTVQQVRDAIAAVGPRQADIEMHLKGSRSTSNSDRVHAAGD